jgi:hypothetical protein
LLLHRAHLLETLLLVVVVVAGHMLQQGVLAGVLAEALAVIAEIQLRLLVVQELLVKVMLVAIHHKEASPEAEAAQVLLV